MLARPDAAHRRPCGHSGRPLLRFGLSMDDDQGREAPHAAPDREAFQPVVRSAAVEVQRAAQPREPDARGVRARDDDGDANRTHRRIFFPALVLPAQARTGRKTRQGQGDHRGQVRQ